MYKFMGMTAEVMRHEHYDITGTDQWKNFLKGILIYIRHVLVCPRCGFRGFDVEGISEFLENVKKDPSYIEQFFSRDQRTRQAEKDYYDADFSEADSPEAEAADLH